MQIALFPYVHVMGHYAHVATTKESRLSLNVCTWKLALEDVARARHYKYIAPMIRRSWQSPQTKIHPPQDDLLLYIDAPRFFTVELCSALLPARAYLNSTSLLRFFLFRGGGFFFIDARGQIEAVPFFYPISICNISFSRRKYYILWSLSLIKY